MPKATKATEDYYRWGICDKKATSGTAPCTKCNMYVHFKCTNTMYKEYNRLYKNPRKPKKIVCSKCSDPPQHNPEGSDALSGSAENVGECVL